MINDDKLSSLERLHKLKTDGVITEEDFEKAKQDLLRPGPAQRPAASAIMAKWDGTLPAIDDYVEWLLMPLRRYADFDGRSTRREFWMFLFVYLALFLVSVVIAAVIPSLGVVVFVLGALGLFIPQLALQVRRFHDQDNSGWFALFNLIPYLGFLIVLVFMAMDGTPGENQYGPDPKQRVL